jgi:hypothetical protein
MPLPVELVLDHPAIRVAPNAAYHMVIALTLQFWRSGCLPLPTDHTTLIAIARTDAGTWRRHHPAVLTALAVMCPEIGRYYGKRVEGYRKMVERARNGAIAANASMRARRAAQSAIPPDTQTMPEPPQIAVGGPARAKRYLGTGREDMAARAASLERSAAISRTRGGAGELKGLTDAALAPPSEPQEGAFGPWQWQPGAAPNPPTEPPPAG